MGGETTNTMSSSTSSYPLFSETPKGKTIHNIAVERLRQFTAGGQYQSQNLLSKLYEGRANGDEDVKLSVYSPPDTSRPTFKEATSNKFKKTHVEESFGPSWSTHWFRVELKVPSHLAQKNHLEFHWDTGSEGLLWTESGEPIHGLTGGGERVEYILPEAYRDGEVHVFYVEMACNGMFGCAPGGDLIQPPKADKYFQLRTADIVAVNLEARALYYDFWIVGDAAREFPEDSWEEHEALQTCNKIMDTFIAGTGSIAAIEQCRKIAKTYLGDDIDSAKVYRGDQEALVTAVGHCHIDTCWLWPWAETKRKVARSWSNQCDLMDRYPELRFACSQAQQYKWLEQYYPSLYDRVKEKVKQGSFNPIGGSWVEHDTNMPSGESLVRQFLYGQRFFESHFGQRCMTFWLPDTFGYSTQLPQLCRLAGMTRFLTQKLSWNNINKFPHTTFNWVALDGSQVICHMPPSETYTAEANWGDVKRSVTQHKSLDQDNTSLLVFGKGDGGGGPTFGHLEKLRRCRGMSDKVGRLPRLKMGETVDDFFSRLERRAANDVEYVTWYGELYFELHRGTYTTQANNKRNNRKSEIMMREIEYLATLASLSELKTGSKESYRYPKKEIDFMWEAILLCQFHDCLPGSSIEMCYDDSDELYEQVFATGKEVKANALKALGIDEVGATKGESVVLNLLPWPRSEIIKLPVKSQTSHYAHVSGRSGILDSRELTAASSESSVSIKETSSGYFELSNKQYSIEVSDGAILSLYDRKAKRELIPKGCKANQFVLFDDKPLYWQAWDVEVYHLKSRQELTSGKSVITERGPHRVSLTTETKISEKSSIKSTISLCAVVASSNTEKQSSSPSPSDEPSTIDVDCHVTWHETMKFLKVEFPVDITNTEAAYETQFGTVRRPTHYNTSWDLAKFEVCCHKWADLSEAGYGVSILNDSKYGFATCGKTMRLSLLRAPKAPDAHADMGTHRIRYAILPHAGQLSAVTVRKAFEFNSPLEESVYALSSSLSSGSSHEGDGGGGGGGEGSRDGISALFSSIRLDSPDSHIILDTVKRGEDDEDVSRRDGLAVREGKSVVLRVYDCMGGRCRGRLVWNDGLVPVKRVWKCNVLEDDGEEMAVDRDGMDGVEFELRAFEVATFRLQL